MSRRTLIEHMDVTTIKRSAWKFHEWFSGAPPIAFALVGTLLGYALVIPEALVVSLLGISSAAGPNMNSLARVIVIGVIAAPLIETLIHQKFVYWIVVDKFGWSLVSYVFLSAALFGASHYYSVNYVIFGFFVGLTLGYAYAAARMKRREAYWLTAVIHALHNSFSSLLQL
ncbi:MAG TPA: CPBP family glutamic-type intramembrane protease, partial [Steroidobacteraceae bacterium]|nr:CPBP family glutamic-type intramembrane protease [Steroidobacteraceae bacterium]